MSLLFFSGGTGTPKLLEGMKNLVSDDSINIICNTGDDFIWNSLHVSPDLDTVLYLFAGILDLEKYWGRKNETFHTLETLQSLGESTWFQVGDRDLGLHIFRSHLLTNDFRLTEITNLVREKWKINARIFPMSDQKVTTIIESSLGKLHFQEYFVKYKTDVDVLGITFEGSKNANIPDEVMKALNQSKVCIIGPSNPITSIGPILSIPSYHRWLLKRKIPVIAISPIVGSKAFSGPTSKLMEAVGYEKSPLGLAEMYKGLIDILILDDTDRAYSQTIQDLGIECIFTNISMKSLEEKTKLAQFVLDLI